MKIVTHRDGTYSITGLTMSDVRDIEASLFGRYASFLKSAEAGQVPSEYSTWSLDTYRSISQQIADRHREMAKLLQDIAYPPA